MLNFSNWQIPKIVIPTPIPTRSQAEPWEQGDTGRATNTKPACAGYVRHLFSNGTRTVALSLVLMVLLVGGCAGEKQTGNKLTEDGSDSQELENSLIFNDVTLEQVDVRGRLLWKVEAKEATYNRDEKIAIVHHPNSELYQDGKLAFQVTAQKGEIHQDEKKIFLKGEIIATAVADGAILRGKELEWNPQEDILIVRNNLTGTHPQVSASAAEARVFSRDRRMELLGQVSATTKSPKLQMQTEKLVWLMQDQQVIGFASGDTHPWVGAPGRDLPIQIDRYKREKVTGKAVANASLVDLKANTLTLKQDAKLTLSEPPVHVTSESMTWNLATETIASDQLVKIDYPQQQVTLTGNKGQVDLQKQIASLTGNVRGIGTRNQSQLEADKITWYIASEEMAAEGNVNYRQADPPLNLKGAKAFGRLPEQNIVVKSDESGGRCLEHAESFRTRACGRRRRVVTEIIP
ncbi:MAG: LPS export ABC transporter periplasmic protein LptC [Hormoscilla sp. GUM202]|nr:LPS export ABC transporter periplasmic protein LptC [Hormoscilla sp. GUM202]